MGFFDSLKEMVGLSSPKSPEELALLAAIRLAPEADEPRLAYAEYLTAKQDPWGEYIRLAIEFSHLDPDDPRHAELDSRLNEIGETKGRKWVKPLAELELEPRAYNIYSPTFWLNRGMVEKVTIDKRAVVPGKLERLLELAPGLLEIEFARCSPDWSAIAATPGLQRLRRLILEEVKMSLADVKAVVGSPYLAQLQKLDLSNKDYGQELVPVLAKLKQLRSLTLHFCKFDDAAAQQLAALPSLANLESLDLAYNQIGDDGATAIAASPSLQQLTNLKLGSNQLKSAGAIALAKAKFPKLRELDISSGELDAAAIAAIAKASWLGQLRLLNVDYCRLKDHDLLPLVQSPQLKGLRQLGLCSSESSSEVVQALLSNPALANLKELKLYGIPAAEALKPQLIAKFGEGVVQM